MPPRNRKLRQVPNRRATKRTTRNRPMKLPRLTRSHRPAMTRTKNLLLRLLFPSSLASSSSHGPRVKDQSKLRLFLLAALPSRSPARCRFALAGQSCYNGTMQKAAKRKSFWLCWIASALLRCAPAPCSSHASLPQGTWGQTLLFVFLLIIPGEIGAARAERNKQENKV